jgi:hypothetical protein
LRLRCGSVGQGVVRYAMVRFGEVRMKSKITKNTFELDEIPQKKFPWYSRPSIELWRILRKYVYQRDFGKCKYCGEQIELNKCHIHHQLELGRGGTNHPSNLVVSCKDCHKQKHPFMMDARDKMRNMEE